MFWMKLSNLGLTCAINYRKSKDIIIDARTSGLIESEAERGLERAKNITRGKIDCVRIIGDRYDITFTEFQ